MTENDLVQEYADIYSRIRSLVNDDEIYRPIGYEAFKELVSPKEWVPVPSFELTLDNVKKSDKGHITFRIKDNKFMADLIFHKTAAVERFMNITQSFSKKEYDSFIELLKQLDKKYSIICQYDTIFIDSPPDWKTFSKSECDNLDDGKINEVFNSVKSLIEMRNTTQKQAAENMKVTISVLIGRIELNNPPKDEELKEAFSNLAQLIRITHNLKTNSEINTIAKKIEKQKQKIKDLEEHLNRIRPLSSSVKEFSEEKIKELEKDLEKEKDVLKELEEGHTSEHIRDDKKDDED